MELVLTRSIKTNNIRAAFTALFDKIKAAIQKEKVFITMK